MTATDSAAALQNPGSVGVSAYLSSAATAGMTLSVDDLVATDPNAASQPQTAIGALMPGCGS